MDMSLATVVGKIAQAFLTLSTRLSVVGHALTKSLSRQENLTTINLSMIHEWVMAFQKKLLSG